MLKGIDHLVLLVSDLQAASADYSALGFNVVQGGRHGSGTHNALIPFADGSYLELIAFYETNPRHRWWRWQMLGGGFIDYCMITDALDADLAFLRARGVAMGKPYPLTRTRPDGFKLDWVIAVPEEPRTSGAPFLIRDHTPRSERVPAGTHHENGITGVDAVTYAVQDLALVDRWTKGLPGCTVAQIARADLNASGVRVTVASNAIEFLAPSGPDSALTKSLDKRGPSPFEIRLASAAHSTSFDAGKTWNVRLVSNR